LREKTGFTDDTPMRVSRPPGVRARPAAARASHRREEPHVTQRQLDRAVASRTGETLRTVNRFGFSLETRDNDGPGTDRLRLLVDCPFCNRPADYPGLARGGAQALAECDRCDIFFDFTPGEVYAG
jgi:hypothetical protein